jgi:allophanate hydrolase subunit 1
MEPNCRVFDRAALQPMLLAAGHVIIFFPMEEAANWCVEL